MSPSDSANNPPAAAHAEFELKVHDGTADESAPTDESNSEAGHIDTMPQHLSFNRFIVSSYRPYPLSVCKCFRSMAQIHNETGAIYSHLLPLMIALAACGDPWGSEHATYYTQMGLICMVFVGSVLYHTLMPMQSAKVYNILLMVDYAGIWLLLTVLPQLTIIRWGLEECTDTRRYSIHAAYAASSLTSLCILLFPVIIHGDPGTALQRLMALALQFIARLVLYILRASLSCGRTSALKYYGAMELLSLIGGAVNAARIPERWCPGQLDVAINSHQLMHIIVTGALCVLWFATKEDFNAHSNA